MSHILLTTVATATPGLHPGTTDLSPEEFPAHVPLPSPLGSALPGPLGEREHGGTGLGEGREGLRHQSGGQHPGAKLREDVSLGASSWGQAVEASCGQALAGLIARARGCQWLGLERVASLGKQVGPQRSGSRGLEPGSEEVL